MSLPPRMGDPITGKPRSYEEKLAMENAKLANAPPDPNRRIYLRVPFREKKVAIGFGAIFDTDRNRRLDVYEFNQVRQCGCRPPLPPARPPQCARPPAP